MSQGTYPGSPVDGPTRIVALVTALHVAGMHPHPHRHRLTGERLLDGQAAGNRVAGPGEGRHERVPQPLLNRPHPVVTAHLLIHDLVQACDGSAHALRVGLPPSGGAVHVGEQQRHRPRRQQKIAFAHRQLPPLQGTAQNSYRQILAHTDSLRTHRRQNISNFA